MSELQALFSFYYTFYRRKVFAYKKGRRPQAADPGISTVPFATCPDRACRKTLARKYVQTRAFILLGYVPRNCNKKDQRTLKTITIGQREAVTVCFGLPALKWLTGAGIVGTYAAVGHHYRRLDRRNETHLLSTCSLLFNSRVSSTEGVHADRECRDRPGPPQYDGTGNGR